MKTCKTCKTVLDESFFHPGRHNCKRCVNAAKQKRYYEAGGYDAIKDRVKRNIRYKKGYYQRWKAEQECFFCKEDNPELLDMHHMVPEEKDVDVSYLVSRGSLKRLGAEIEKCNPLCKKCHPKVTNGDLTFPPGTANCVWYYID